MLRSIFRDREDFSGGDALNDATIAALDASATVIVLCSPVAAGRPAINEEVRLFRSRHPNRPWSRSSSRGRRRTIFRRPCGSNP
jgi:hypothetical protein